MADFNKVNLVPWYDDLIVKELPRHITKKMWKDWSRFFRICYRNLLESELQMPHSSHEWGFYEMPKDNGYCYCKQCGVKIRDIGGNEECKFARVLDCAI